MGAEKNILLPFNAFLLFSQWAAFIALMVYYSGPANYVSKTRMEVDYHYGYPAYNCTPLVADEVWGHYFNYDTCKALSAPPTKGINVAMYEAEEPEPSDGVAGFVNDMLSGSTTDKGYVYYPFPHLGTEVGNLAGLHEKTYSANLFSSGAAATAAQSSKAAKMKTLNACGLDAGYSDSTSGPWVISTEKHPIWSENTSVQPTKTAPCVDYGPEIGNSNLGLSDLYTENSCYFNHSWPMLQDVMDLLGIDEWVSPGTDEVLLLENFDVALAYKRGLSMCTITEDEAVNMFQEYYNDGLCNYAKANAPFSCTSEEPPSIPQRFSLAYANSLLLYTVFSTICVKIFFASRKEPKDEVTESEEKSTRV